MQASTIRATRTDRPDVVDTQYPALPAPRRRPPWRAFPRAALRPGRSRTLPMKPFLDGPTSIGLPRTASSGRRLSIARLCSVVFPNPIPGSMAIWSSPMPADVGALDGRAKEERHLSHEVARRPGSPASSPVFPACASARRRLRAPAITSAMPGSAVRAVMSLTIEAPAASDSLGDAGAVCVDRDGAVPLLRAAL